MVLSTEPAPAASVRQDYGQLHKHFTDKDGQLFTDEAKVLLAAATAWARMCVCVEKVWVCEKVRERERERGGGWWGERGWQREPLNVRPLLVWTPTGLSAGTHLSNALNAAPTLDCTISLSATKYRARGIRRSLSVILLSCLYFILLHILRCRTPPALLQQSVSAILPPLLYVRLHTS